MAKNPWEWTQSPSVTTPAEKGVTRQQSPSSLLPDQQPASLSGTQPCTLTRIPQDKGSSYNIENTHYLIGNKSEANNCRLKAAQSIATGKLKARTTLRSTLPNIVSVSNQHRSCPADERNGNHKINNKSHNPSPGIISISEYSVCVPGSELYLHGSSSSLDSWKNKMDIHSPIGGPLPSSKETPHHLNEVPTTELLPISIFNEPNKKRRLDSDSRLLGGHVVAQPLNDSSIGRSSNGTIQHDRKDSSIQLISDSAVQKSIHNYWRHSATINNESTSRVDSKSSHSNNDGYSQPVLKNSNNQSHIGQDLRTQLDNNGSTPQFEPLTLGNSVVGIPKAWLDLHPIIDMLNQNTKEELDRKDQMIKELEIDNKRMREIEIANQHARIHEVTIIPNIAELDPGNQRMQSEEVCL
jgi:hypothetical protein